MSESKFKTLRHIETVRNYLNWCVRELLDRAEKHDQSKLESPEVEIFEEFTPKLRGVTYASPEYKAMMAQMLPAIDHHNSVNPHHPEHFTYGIEGMTLIDLLEMLCDWRAASLRHNDGDIMRSIQVNQDRFKYGDQLKKIFENTAHELKNAEVRHKANES